MAGTYRIEGLGAHDRVGFASGVDAPDQYFRERVTQDIRRRATACFVAVDRDAHHVAGYYTIAASSVPLDDAPVQLAKLLPRYPLVPVARLGRLAVDRGHRGRKLGAALLWDAASRAARSELAVCALVVDAKDAETEAFYVHHGFATFGSGTRQLILSLTKFVAVG